MSDVFVVVVVFVVAVMTGTMASLIPWSQAMISGTMRLGKRPNCKTVVDISVWAPPVAMLVISTMLGPNIASHMSCKRPGQAHCFTCVSVLALRPLFWPSFRTRKSKIFSKHSCPVVTLPPNTSIRNGGTDVSCRCCNFRSSIVCKCCIVRCRWSGGERTVCCNFSKVQ